jgi:outer membrane protein TolC
MQEKIFKMRNLHHRNNCSKTKVVFKLFLFISTYFYLFLFISIPSFSQSDSLYYYLEIAAKNNPIVQQKFTEYEVALQKIPQVGSLSDPELSIGVFFKPMELVSGNQIADVRLMQMFPWFGVLRNAKDEMSLMANAKFEVFRDAKLQLSYDLQKTWYDLYKIQKDISISEKNIEILKVIERLAIVNFKATPFGSPVGATSSGSVMSSASNQNSPVGGSGMQTMGNNQPNSGTIGQSESQVGSMVGSSGNSGLTGLYQIEIEMGDLENSIALLKNQEQSLIALFNSYLNRSPVSPILTGELTVDSLRLSLIAVSDSMLAKNPMLSMLEFEKKSFEAREKMVTAMGYPMVGLGINYSLIQKTSSEMASSDMNGNDMVMPMVTVTLPIYRKKYTAMQTEATINKETALLNYQATVNSLQTEYYQAILLYQDSQRRIALYENQSRLATSSFDLSLKSFSASSSGLTDVLRSQQQMLNYELKQVEAVADFNTAIAWLKRLGNMETQEEKDGNKWK